MPNMYWLINNERYYVDIRHDKELIINNIMDGNYADSEKMIT